MSLFVFSCVFSYVCVLLAVAFFTFLERKGLGYMQSRKGPNKVGLVGLVQPISDAVKLLSKESVEPNVSNYALYYIMPVFSLVLAFFLWGLYPSFYSLDYYKWGALFFLCVSGLNVYGVLLAGWSSNSKYALLGSLRAIAQTISYEISMVFILLFPLFLYGTFSFIDVMEYQIFGWIGCLLGPIFFMWFVSCIAETNRAPFDFAEGESELVSGFNVEYSASGFVLIFLAEYANILVMSLFSVVLFLGGYCFMGLCSDLVLIFKTLLVSFVFIWVRGSYPRFRYDLLMSLTWKVFLPMSLCVLLVVLALSFLVFY